MAQVGADGIPASVEDLLDQAQLMKGLIPVLPLCVGREHAVTGAGKRRGHDERPDPGSPSSSISPTTLRACAAAE
ncbi:MAG: hypothetical protein ACLP0L_14420 [Solirubrobacteraceae bacterium]